MRQENAKTSEGIRADSRASADSLERSISVIRGDLRAEMDGQSRQLGSAATRVDNAIQDMHNQFKELAGTQLRKPKLECRVRGMSLEGRIIDITPKNNNIHLDLKNIGDSTAKITRYKLYSDIVSDCNKYILSGWTPVVSDEPNYKCSYQTYSGITIDSQDSQSTDIDILEIDSSMQGNHPSVLKIFYEQPEPRKYNFVISINKIK